jgi:hypothetical protein
MNTVRFTFGAALLFRALLAGGQSPPVAQPHNFFERGPLSLTGLVGYQLNVDPGPPSDEQGVSVQGFQLSATGGILRIKRTTTLSAVEGTISTLSITGEKSELQGNNKPLLVIQKANFSCTLQLTKDITLVSYGGTITVPKGSVVQLTNSSKTKISGTSMTGQTGTLSLSAKQATWKNAKFEFPYLPDAIPIDLRSRDATPIMIEVPLDTLQPIVTLADFDAQIGTSLSKRPFDISTDTYKSHFTGLTVAAFSVHLTRNRLELAVRGLSCTGELVGKALSAPPVPVLTSGRLRISNLSATSSLSKESAKLQDVQLKGISLNPAVISRSDLDNDTSSFPLGRTVHLLPAAFRPEEASPQASGDPSHVSISAREQQFLAELNLGSPGEQQHNAIEQAQKQLTSYSGPSFLLNLPGKQLSNLIDNELTSIHVPSTTVSFDKQQILVTTRVMDPALGLKGITFVLVVSPSIEKSNIVLRYALSLAALTSVEIPGSIPLEKLLDLIQTHSSDMQITVGNPNANVTVPIPTNIFQPINLNMALPPDPATQTQINLVSAPTTLTLNIVGADLLIDSDGIHVLAQLLLN